MDLKNVMNKTVLKGKISAIGLKLASVRPEIMLITGGISVLVGTIYACKKTDEGKEVFQKAKKDADGVSLILKEAKKTVTDEAEFKRIKFESGKDYCRIYGKLVYVLAKVYGIPALLWFGGMGMIFGSHGEIRKINSQLIANSVAAQKLLQEYRERVAKAVGDETEQKIYFGAQEGMVKVLETDEKTGEKKIVEKKADIFYAQPGSIFARNYTEDTTDAFDYHSYAIQYLEKRVDEINTKLKTGEYRAFTGLDILRMLGFNENALTERFDDDEAMDKLLRYGISANARKVPDPEMRKLKIEWLRGYRKKWDVERNMEVYEPCMRIDFNFYPLEGKI